MFSFIPVPKNILELDAVQRKMAQGIAKKTPMQTVVGNGDNIFSLFAFTLDPARPNGYRIVCHNLRDPDANNFINPDELPAGFYCVVQTKAGNFYAMRAGIGASSHPKVLEHAGLDKSQSNVLGAGELFVGPKGKMLFFNASSGGYHPATTENYILDSKADHAKQLAKMGLPVALIVGNHHVCGLEEMYGIEKVFFQNTGKWNYVRSNTADYEGATNELNQLIAQNSEEIYFSPDVIQTLDETSKAFVICVAEGALEFKEMLDKEKVIGSVKLEGAKDVKQGFDQPPMLSKLFVPAAKNHSHDDTAIAANNTDVKKKM